MTLWELRQLIEANIPWWTPLAIFFSAVFLYGVYIGFMFAIESKKK